MITDFKDVCNEKTENVSDDELMVDLLNKYENSLSINQALTQYLIFIKI
jgi:hypothetical protein